MAVIGGDLGAMSALAQRFGASGQTFQSQTSGISASIDRALQTFVDQMRSLDQEARGLAEEINGEMVRLNGQTQATTWTGANRQQMDSVVATLDDDIVRIKAAIDQFADEASSVVNGALTSAMTELRTNTETTGAQAATVAGNFSQSVESQRASFDSVLNG